MKAAPFLKFLMLTMVIAVAFPFAAHAADEPKDAAAPEVATPVEATPGDPATVRPRAGLSQEAAEQGEAELHKSVRVFQQRYLIKTHRAELLLGGTSTFNDPMIHHYGADASLLFHLSERWALGVGGAKWFAKTRSAFNTIERDYGLFPEKSQLQAGGWGEIQYSPVFGKFTSFGLAVVQVDAYLVAAGGAVRTTRGEALKPAGQIGIGIRVHTLRWLTLSFEVRDLILRETFQRCATGSPSYEACGTQTMNHWFGGLRIGIWIPPTVQYQHQR